MRYKSSSSIVVTLIFLVCSSVFADRPSAKIGMLLPLSGQYASIGLDCQQAVEIAKLEIDPNLNLEFIYADSKAEAAQAVVEFKKLIDIDKIIAGFVFRGPPGMAINPLSKSAKMPILGGVSNKDFALSNDYAFQLWSRSDFEGEFLATALKSKGIKKIALVTVQDDYPVAVSLGFREKIKNLGLEIIIDEEVLPSEVDFRTQISKLRRASTDAIFLNVGLGQIAPMLVQLRQLGIESPLYSNFWAGKKEVITAAGKAAEGVIFAEMSTNLENLRKDLNSKFNTSPSGATLSTYVATIMLAQAISGLSEISAQALHSALSEIKEIKTRNGNFEVKDRFVQFPMSLRVIHSSVVEDLK